MLKERFDYTTWALRAAAAALESDLGCGFDVADATPDREKAVAAVGRIIRRLQREADRRDPAKTI